MTTPEETTMYHRLIIIIIVALAGACDDNAGPVSTAVVQETNVPCTQDTCTCDREYVYYREVIKDCDSMVAQLSVCSDVPVCASVIDAVAAQVLACAEPASPFVVDVGACDQ